MILLRIVQSFESCFKDCNFSSHTYFEWLTEEKRIYFQIATIKKGNHERQAPVQKGVRQGFLPTPITLQLVHSKRNE